MCIFGSNGSMNLGSSNSLTPAAPATNTATPAGMTTFVSPATLSANSSPISANAQAVTEAKNQLSTLSNPAAGGMLARSTLTGA